MKAIRIATIACWIVAAVVLLGLAMWFLTGRMFGIGILGLSFGSGEQNGGILDSLTGPFEVAGSYSVPADSLSSISIDWVAGDITVMPHDGNEVQITEFARRELSYGEQLFYSTSGGTLTIKFTERSSWLNNMPAKKLEVYVPHALMEKLDRFAVDSTSGTVSAQNINADAVKIDTVSGNIDLSNIASRTFEADSTSGSITLTSIETDDMKLNSMSGAISLSDVSAGTLKGDTVSGRCDLDGMFGEVDIDSVSGRISIISTIVPAKLKVDTTSGGITVTVPDEGAISVNHSSVSGRLSSDIPIITQGRDAQFQLSSVSGGVKIQALG